MGLRIDRIVSATGSAGTHAGLVVGLQGCNAGIPVLGIGVRNPKDRQETMVHTPRRGDRRLCRRARRHSARGGGGELRLYRRRLRPADRGHGRSGADAGAAGGRVARPGVFRQGDGGADRPDPQGGVRQGRDGWCSCTPAARSDCSVTPGSSSKRWGKASGDGRHGRRLAIGPALGNRIWGGQGRRRPARALVALLVEPMRRVLLQALNTEATKDHGAARRPGASEVAGPALG